MHMLAMRGEVFPLWGVESVFGDCCSSNNQAGSSANTFKPGPSHY